VGVSIFVRDVVDEKVESVGKILMLCMRDIRVRSKEVGGSDIWNRCHSDKVLGSDFIESGTVRFGIEDDGS